MASEQMVRRENKNNDRVVDREVQVEKQRKESLADKGRVVRESERKEKEKELVSDRAKEVEEGRRGRESGVQHAMKFETKDEEQKGLGRGELEGRTRVVVGRVCNKEEKQRSRPRGKVEAEKARPVEKTREEAKGKEKDGTKGQTKKGGGEEQARRREETGEENKQSSLEEISKSRAEAQQKAKERKERAKANERNMQASEGPEEGRRERESGGGVHHVAKFEMKGEENKDSVGKEELERRTREVVGRDWNKEEKQRNSPRGKVEAEKARPIEETNEEEKLRNSPRGRVEAEKARLIQETKVKAQGREKAQTKEGGGEEQGRGKEENEEPSLEEISKYRAEAQQKSFNAIEAAKERYERAKEAGNEAARDRNKEEKHVPREKGQEEVNLRSEDDTQDNGQKGYGGAKDTIGSVDHITTPLVEKAKAAGSNTSQYVGEKAAQAKDATVETGKNTAEVAAELRDKALATGWSAACYSTEVTMAATNAVMGAAEYAGHKASDIAAKSVDTAKSFASSAGENANDYTARKKVEAERELEAEKDLEAKREAQNQEFKERPSSESTTYIFQRGQGQKEEEQGGEWEEGGGIVGEREQKPFASIIGESIQGVQEKGSEVMASIGETLGSAAQTMKKPLDKATEGGREVLGAVGETVVEIGENMVKPAQKVQHQGEVGGVINAIGETIAEIAETTKVIVAGEGEKEIITSFEYEKGDLKLD